MSYLPTLGLIYLVSDEMLLKQIQKHIAHYEEGEIALFKVPALRRKVIIRGHPFLYIPGFLYDPDTVAENHGPVNTGLENINLRISDDLFRAHTDDAIDKL